MLTATPARLAKIVTSSGSALALALRLLCRPLATAPGSPSPAGDHEDRRQPGSGPQEQAPPPPPQDVPLPPPVLPASQQPAAHWLESLGGLRHWLEDKNRAWWIKGLVEARCK